MGPSTEARCSMRECVPPRLVALVTSFSRPETDMAALAPPRTTKESMPPKLKRSNESPYSRPEMHSRDY